MTDEKKTIEYDYEKQAWVVNGRYARCGHSPGFDCQCYGRLHEGEEPLRRNWIKAVNPKI